MLKTSFSKHCVFFNHVGMATMLTDAMPTSFPDSRSSKLMYHIMLRNSFGNLVTRKDN